MTSQSVGLRVASVLFALFCLAHGVRLLTRTEVVVAGHALAVWPSVVAMLVAGGLSLWMWKLSSHGMK
jgi:hypothetical protein